MLTRQKLTLSIKKLQIHLSTVNSLETTFLIESLIRACLKELEEIQNIIDDEVK